MQKKKQQLPPLVSIFGTDTFLTSSIGQLLDVYLVKNTNFKLKQWQEEEEESLTLLLHEILLKRRVCMLRPNFDYIPQTQSEACCSLRRAENFLPSEVLQRLSKYSVSTNTEMTLCTHKELTQNGIFNQTPQINNTVKGIVVAYITMSDLLFYANNKDHQELEQNIAEQNSSTDKCILRRDWKDYIMRYARNLFQQFSYPKYRIIFLLGPETRQLLNKYSEETSVDELVAELLLKYYIDMWWTTSEKECVEVIARFATSIESGISKPVLSAFKSRGSRSISFPSGVSETEKRWLNQLLEIPGIELQAAKAIAKRFPTPSDIIELLNSKETEIEQIKLISEIEVQRFNGPKKIGLALASRLQRLFSSNANPADWIISR